MRRRHVVVLILLVLALAYGIREALKEQDTNVPVHKPVPADKVTINEAVHTLLYLPIYHADKAGFFKSNGIEPTIVTGGTASNSMAAMFKGEADFAVADPMYAPISQAQGSDAVVVAQVVGRIAVWGVVRGDTPPTLTADWLRGKTVSTHTKPMTAFLYTKGLIEKFGLVPDTDTTILQCTPGTETAPLFADRASMAVTLEPGTSQAESQGARVIYSFASENGDRVFTGLMTRKAYLESHDGTVARVVLSIQQAIAEMRTAPARAVDTAAAVFPTVDRDVLRRAVQRMVSDKVIPDSVLISEASWNNASAPRVAAGDLKVAPLRADNCAVQVMERAASGE